MSPVVGPELELGFTVGAGGVNEPERAGKTSTFTLLPGVDPNISGTFAYGRPRHIYNIRAHMAGGVITTTDERIKQGLRDLKIFQES